MNETNNNVTVTKEEYTKIIKIAERAAIIERLLKTREHFISMAEIKAILDIKDGSGE